VRGGAWAADCGAAGGGHGNRRARDERGGDEGPVAARALVQQVLGLRAPTLLHALCNHAAAEIRRHGARRGQRRQAGDRAV
jgi:hypothetical protein